MVSANKRAWFYPCMRARRHVVGIGVIRYRSGSKLSHDGGLGHALTHKRRQTAPATIFQAMNKRVRRGLRNSRPKALGAPFRTFEASAGGKST